MNITEIKAILDRYFSKINSEIFIQNDPVQIPHLFTKKEDIEISAFLTSIIALGNRKQIIANAYKLLEILHNSPFEFIIQLKNKHRTEFEQFKHRFINGNDMFNFCMALKYIYTDYDGLEGVFVKPYLERNNVKYSLQNCYNIFSTLISDKHSLKHISNVDKNSPAKRLNLFLRWMTRKDPKKIDFGIWQNISPSDIYIPLDVHVGYAARKLNILHRKTNDWQTVEILTNNLKLMDKNDPIKYDLALFEYSIQTKK